MDRDRAELVRILRRRPGAPWFPDEWGILDGNNTETRFHTTGAGPLVALDIPIPFSRSLGALVMVQARRPSVPATGSWFFHVSWKRDPSPAAPVLVGALAIGLPIFEAPFTAVDVTFAVSADGGTILVTPPAVLTDETTWNVRALLIGTDE